MDGMTPPVRLWLRRAIRWIALGIAAWYALSAVAILCLRWINPRTTAVQIQRRHRSANCTSAVYQAVSVRSAKPAFSPDLQHAVIAAEDGRFWQHHGFDWQEVHKVSSAIGERGKLDAARQPSPSS